MTDTTNYFEVEYRRLRKNGSGGWGGTRYSHRCHGWRDTLRKFGNLLGLEKPPLTILEIGCGNGMVSREVASLGHRVTGVDVSQTAVDWSKELFDKEGLSGRFLTGNACDMNFLDDQTFDVTIDGNCLHCIIGPDRARFLSETFRTTKTGGYFLLSSMCGPPRSLKAKENFDEESLCLMKGDKPWRFLPSQNILMRECVSIGFQPVWAKQSSNLWWDHVTILFQRPLHTSVCRKTAS